MGELKCKFTLHWDTIFFTSIHCPTSLHYTYIVKDHNFFLVNSQMISYILFVGGGRL